MAGMNTRQRIVEIADQLIYQHGFAKTSFADIADAVGISRGNFYHHFKTKDDILEAVIELRLSRTQQMLEKWEKEGETPTERIQSFIHILIMNRSKIKQYGCPVGTLCTELAKLEHAAQSHANELFGLFRTWLRKQFSQLGCRQKADELAMHLLMRSQGIATMASAFNDEKYIRKEVQNMHDWLNTTVVQECRQ
jgi:TetR/AcrR family transcriptional repressor of nem operon